MAIIIYHHHHHYHYQQQTYFNDRKNVSKVTKIIKKQPKKRGNHLEPKYAYFLLQQLVCHFYLLLLQQKPRRPQRKSNPSWQAPISL